MSAEENAHPAELAVTIEALVIGAGHAGLTISRMLGERGVEHLVLERASVGSSWRQRWASFYLNTPNGICALPGAASLGDDEGFTSRDAWVEYLERYQADNALPVRTGVHVRAVEPRDGGFTVRTSAGDFLARKVIVCSGDQNTPRVPELASALPEEIDQLHSSRYASPEALRGGGVLVVGSGQSGGQIVEELLQAGRRVWLCTSKVGRAPRRYRGRDVTTWARAVGMFYQPTSDVPAAERAAPQVMISGTEGGHSLSLPLLANAGATLLGRLIGVDGSRLSIGDDLLAHVAAGDEAAARLKEGLDRFIGATGAEATAPEADPADEPCPQLEAMAAVRTLDLVEAGISTVIWATGYGGDFSYLPAEFLDDEGRPQHDGGEVTPGLYCLGLTWLRTRASGLIAGAIEDAAVIAEKVAG